jgi:hypothetical protein
MKKHLLLGLLSTTLIAIGCGGSGSGGGGSCTQNQGGVTICTETTITAATQAICGAFDGGTPSGTFSASSCPRVGAVGGCMISATGGSATSWAYAGSADELRARCAAQGGTFVTP